MRLDTPREPVVHRRHPDSRLLERPEATLYHKQGLVTAGGIFGRERVVVRLDDPFPVVLRSVGDRLAVDPDWAKRVAGGNGVVLKLMRGFSIGQTPGRWRPRGS